MNDQNNNNQELNKSAQNVHSFGVQNDDKQTKEEIGNRINESKKKNLDNNTKRTSKDTAGEMDSSSGSSLPKKDGLESGESTSLKNNLNPKNMLKNAGRNALRKKSQDDTLAGDAAKVANKALDTKAKIDSAKAIIKFLLSPKGKIIAMIGAGLLGLIVTIVLAAVLANPFQLIISSIGMKFGLTGEDSYTAATRDNEEYEYMYENADREYDETYDRTDVECMVDGSTGKVNEECEKKTEKKNLTCADQSLFRKIWLWIFKSYDPTNACELMQFVRRELNSIENTTDIENIAPGYVVTTFYYAFETQNYNEDGEPFIAYNTDDTDEDDDAVQPSSDIDAINLLFAHKRDNGNALLEKDDVTGLLWQYVYQEHYVYWTYKYDETSDTWYCDDDTYGPEYKVDVDKFKIFLRYGSYGSVGYGLLNSEGYFEKTKYDILNLLPNMEKSGNRGYEADKNIIAAYNATSEECIDKVKDKYGEKPPGLEIYSIMANPDTTTDDGAVLNLASGSYDYSNGYIFKRYPRYMEEFTISGTVTFDFFVAKEIEEFIENISDRQDYSNYLLGYESDVGKLIGTEGSGGISGNYKIVCDYTELEDGSVSSVDGDIQVEWTYPSQLKFDAFDYTPYESMGKTLDLESYVLGSIMLETGGSVEWIENYYATNAEATIKAHSIMIRSYLLANANISSDGTIQIANSTARQLTCDPDEGCYKCWDSNAEGENGNGNYIAVPVDSEFAKNNNQCELIKGLSSDDKLREYVKDVAGQVMVDSNGNVASTGYSTTTLKEWYKKSNTDSSIGDLDYAELLYYQYGDKGFTLDGVECHIEYQGSSSGWDGVNFVSDAGPWDEWKQDDPRWANDPLGYSGATIGGWGCNLVAFAKGLADKAADKITLDNFNPQTFAAIAYDNQCFCGYVDGTCVAGTGANTMYYCAASSVGVSIKGESINLTGSYQDKVNTIASYNNDNTIVILQVKGKSGTHWVYVKGTTSNDIIMSDPSSMHNDTNSVKKAYVDGSNYPDGGEITNFWYFNV